MAPGAVAQALVSGLADGVATALVAVGTALVLRLTRAVPLAQGDLVGGAAGIGVLLLLGAAPSTVTPGVAASVGVVVATLVVGTVLGAGTGLLLARRDDPVLVVAATLGVGLVLRQGLVAAFPRAATAVPDVLHLRHLLSSSGLLHLPGGGTVDARVPAAAAVGALVLGLVLLTVSRSRFGTAVRAVAEDPGAASLVGMPVRTLLLAGFALAGLLAAVASLLAVPGRALTADGGAVLGLHALAAVLLVPSLRPSAAALVALLLGVVTSLVAVFIDPRAGDALPLVLLLLALLPRQRRALRS